MKILTLGHSLAVDSCHMLNMVANTEGIGDYDELVIGTLYYSGCRLDQHVKFMKENSKQYSLYLSSTSEPNKPPVITNNMTMMDALLFECWDLVIMQGGIYEVAQEEGLTNGKIQQIQSFVKENAYNPNAKFAWHMHWVPPVDQSLRDLYMKVPGVTENYYTNKYEPYNGDRRVLFDAVLKCANKVITADKTFEFIIPTATSIENALSSYLEETDLHRDYIHATDYGRLIAAYTWYCKLMGIEKLDAIKVDAIPKVFFKSTKASEDLVLTEDQKNLILESVNNALANPFQLTQSQYTTAP